MAVLSLGEPPSPRCYERPARGAIIGNGEKDGITLGVPVRDDGDAIAELDQAIGLRVPVILDGYAALPKGMAMREQESHSAPFSFSGMSRFEDRAGSLADKGVLRGLPAEGVGQDFGSAAGEGFPLKRLSLKTVRKLRMFLTGERQ